MNEMVQPDNSGDERSWRIFAWCLVILLVYLFLLIPTGLSFPFDILLFVAFAWILFLVRVIPNVSPDYSTIMIGLAAAIVFIISLTVLLRSIRNRAYQSSTDSWSLRSSLMTLLLVASGFVVGTAIIGVAHQVVWLATSDKRIFTYNRGSTRSRSLNRARNIGLAMQNYGYAFEYANGEQHLPPAQTINMHGKAMHSWLTLMLPYLDNRTVYDQIDLSRSWDKEVNQEALSNKITVYLNPALNLQILDPHTKLPVAHYSGNSRLLNTNVGISTEAIKDGRSNTILMGEIISKLEPWGKPAHQRDPALGINKHPYGFGSTYPGGANFIFADGRGRFLNQDIDPKILKALSTPAGGELTPEY